MADAENVDTPLKLLVGNDETLLEELDALLLYGPLAWHMHVTVTDQRVQLLPSRRFERLAGAKGAMFKLSEIESVTWSRLQQQVSIKLEERTLRVTGSGASALYERLNSQLGTDDDAAKEKAEQNRFVAGERVLVEGNVDVVVRDPLWASGTVQLTTERVRFKPNAGMQRLVLSGRPVEMLLSDIVGLQITRSGSGLSLMWAVEDEESGQLELESAMELVRGVMPALTATLQAMGAEVLLPDTPPPSKVTKLQEPMTVTEGRFGDGAIARTGTIAIGTGGVWFSSDDFVASVAGTTAEGLPLRNIIRVQTDSTKPKKLVLHRRGDGDTLALESVRTTFRLPSLAVMLAEKPPIVGVRLDKHGRLDAKEVQNLARVNAAILPEGRSADTMMGAGAVRLTRQGQLIRGWLLVLRSGLMFLPLDGRAQDRAYFDGPLIDRSRSDTDSQGVLKFTVERQQEHFAVCGGQRTARELWHTMWSHLPDARSMADRYPYLKVLVGRIGHVRLKHRQTEFLSRRMVTTTLERNGIGMPVGRKLPDMVGPGLDVEVEMEANNIIYSFRTHLAEVDERDGDIWLTLGLASRVKRRDNRREAYRVSYDQQLRLRRLAHHGAEPDKELIRGTLADISWTGAAILLQQERPIGTLLRTELTFGGSTEDYILEVIYSKKMPRDKGTLHGCRFLDLSAGQQDRIQSAVLRQQMLEVASRNQRSGADKVRQVDEYDSEDTETEKMPHSSRRR